MCYLRGMMGEVDFYAPRASGRGAVRRGRALAALALAWLLALAAACPGGARAAQQDAPHLLTVNKPPLAYYDDGMITGFAVDVVQELERRTGRSAPLSLENYAASYTRARSGPNVALFPVARVPSRESAFKWVGPLFTENVALYARRDSGIALSGLDAARHVGAIAVTEGYASTEHLASRGFTNLVPHRSSTQGADSLRYGRVDLWLVSELTMPSLARQADVDPALFLKVQDVVPLTDYLAFSRDVPDSVVAEWQRALDSMKADGTFGALRGRWAGRMTAGIGPGTQDAPPLIFSPEELVWLQEHPVVTAGVSRDFPPFEYAGPDGGHLGLTRDYVDMVRRRTGLVIHANTMPWTEVLDSVRTGKVDFVPGIVRTPGREEFLLFTRPFLTTPSVIITRDDAPFLAGLGDLRGGRVSVARGFYTEERLRRDHPQLGLDVEPTVGEALAAVSLGRADAYVGDLASATYVIRNAGLTNLKVAARTEYGTDEIAMAVRDDLPQLRDILDKALASMSQAERDAIYDSWIVLPFSGPTGWEEFWIWTGRVSLVVAALLALTLFWLSRLRREIERRDRMAATLADSERRYRNLFENAQVGIMLLREADGQIIAANQRMAELLGHAAPADLMDGVRFGDFTLQGATAKGEPCKDSGLPPGASCCSMRRADGSPVWLDCSQFVDPQTGLATLVAQDVTEQRNAELALRAGQEMMRSLVDAIPFLVAYLGPDRRYRLLNRAGATLLGTQPAEALGRHVSELLPPDVWALLKPYEDKALAGHDVRADISLDYLRRDGAFTAFYAPHLDALGQVHGVAVCLVDITEQKRAEAELRASEQRYRSVVERSKDAIVIISMSGRLLYGNSKATEMFGYSLEEARGMEVSRFFPPDEWTRARTILTQPGEMTYESRMVDRNGRVFMVENSRAVISFESQPAALVFVRDVTERKRAEQLLRQSEERLQMALDSTEFGLWEYRVDEDALELPTRLFCGKYGYIPADLPRNVADWRNAIHPDDLALARKAYKAYMEQGVENLRNEYRVRDGHGGWRWISVHARAVERGQDRRPRRMLGLVQDITERKRAEERLRELATVDGLTGLYNRRHFMETAGRELERARRYRAPLTLLMLDADRFKLINDTHGHDVGDDVLRALADIGRRTVRNVDIFGRLGGEEFAILLPETGMVRAVEVAERLREAFEAFVGQGRDGEPVRFTVSLGVAQAGQDDDLESLLRRADEALYEAKRKGRNRVETA